METEKRLTLRDGAALLLRSTRPEDAQEVLRLLCITAGETGNMVRCPDEWHIHAEQEAQHIREVRSNPRAVELLALVEGRIVGICGVNPVSPRERMRHRAELGVCVLREYWHRGIGSAMVEACLDAARAAGFEQMELMAVSANERALALYRRFGFVQTGLLPHAMKYRDGSYADFVEMILDLTAADVSTASGG